MVVGAGIGGLVAALDLAVSGVAVTLLERSQAPGGKMRRVEVDGVGIDSGPTVFTLRWILEQAFERAGAALGDRLRLSALPVLARHAWPDGSRFDLHADPARALEAVGDFSGAGEARRFEAFRRRAGEVYRRLDGPYIRSQRPDLFTMTRRLGLSGVAELARLGPFASLWSALGREFRDPRLRQLFGRYATYCGASPWRAPATLMLIARVEMDGVWAVEGGMHAVAEAVAALATERGVRIRYGAEASRLIVADGRACGVELAGGERVMADAVVFNGDAGALAQGLLGEEARHAVPPVARAERSLSALTWSMHAKTGGLELDMHNVFFDRDYASEFDDIFVRRRLPRQGTVYVCAQDRAPGAVAPAGRERLLCLVNAPPDGDLGSPSALEIDSCERRMLALLARCGLQMEARAPAVRTTPQAFSRLFPATGGALYGPATHGWTMQFRRPGATSAMPGLFLAGGSVHPGPGVPMAAMSGRLAAAALMASLDSTSRSRAVGISGGTSTRSPTTAGTA
ncbi:MAG: 1-hydroxycarotenoid 3,4-desaturase CrtD [Pseudomonadota bacterium]